MQDVAAFLGFMAGTLTTVSFVPQLIKVYQSKSAKDISYRMFIIFILGVVTWISYGISINELPIIVTNSVTLLVATSILALKIRYDRSDKRMA